MVLPGPLPHVRPQEKNITPSSTQAPPAWDFSLPDNSTRQSGLPVVRSKAAATDFIGLPSIVMPATVSPTTTGAVRHVPCSAPHGVSQFSLPVAASNARNDAPPSSG